MAEQDIEMVEKIVGGALGPIDDQHQPGLAANREQVGTSEAGLTGPPLFGDGPAQCIPGCRWIEQDGRHVLPR